MNEQLGDYLQKIRFQIKTYISISCTCEVFNAEQMREEIDDLSSSLSKVLGDLIDPSEAVISMVQELKGLTRILMTVISLRLQLQKMFLSVATDPKSCSSSDGSDDTNGIKRFRISKKQQDILQNWFIENYSHPYLNGEHIRSLVKSTGLSQVQVKNWVSNRRRKEKSTFISKELEGLLSSDI